MTCALLSEHGYTVGRYVSLEQAIAESADAYYQALLNSTHGWHEVHCPGTSGTAPREDFLLRRGAVDGPYSP